MDPLYYTSTVHTNNTVTWHYSECLQGIFKAGNSNYREVKSPTCNPASLLTSTHTGGHWWATVWFFSVCGRVQLVSFNKYSLCGATTLDLLLQQCKVAAWRCRAAQFCLFSWWEAQQAALRKTLKVILSISLGKTSSRLCVCFFFKVAFSARTTVLASCTSCSWSTRERLRKVVGVRDGELVGQGHGPGGWSRMGEGVEGVLVWGTSAGAIVVMEWQVGHIWEERGRRGRRWRRKTVSLSRFEITFVPLLGRT